MIMDQAETARILTQSALTSAIVRCSDSLARLVACGDAA
jgi:hypothetical protein